VRPTLPQVECTVGDVCLSEDEGQVLHCKLVRRRRGRRWREKESGLVV